MKDTYTEPYLKNYKVDINQLEIDKPTLRFLGDGKLGIDFISVSCPFEEKDKYSPKNYRLLCETVALKDIDRTMGDDYGNGYVGEVITKTGVRYVVDALTEHEINISLYFYEKGNF